MTNTKHRIPVSRMYPFVFGLVVALSPAWSQAAPAAPSARPSGDDIAWLNRVTFGVDSAALQRFQRLGREGFLDQQLRADAGDLPADVAAQIQAMPATQTSTIDDAEQLRQMRQQRKQMKQSGDTDKTALKAYRQRGRALTDQAGQAQLLRAIYDPNQLREQMVWFWSNHFSVYGRGATGWFMADYVDHAIRPHALGKFRDLVMATLKSPAMLLYLNNVRNKRDHTNENYARELMELHTLGVDFGYTQADVQALMHILTGVGLDLRGNAMRPRDVFAGRRARMQPMVLREGVFAFNPRQHDASAQTLLGQRIGSGGFDQVRKAIDLIVRQPACARFISTELARYFVADQPPPALIERMTQTWAHSDGDIAAVLHTLFTAPELAASYGHKFKDPMQFLVSAIRLTRDGQPIPRAQPLLGALNNMSEPLYGRRTPDGWSLLSTGWDSSGQLSQRFIVARAIGSGGVLRMGKGKRANQDQADPPRHRAQPPAIADSMLYQQTLEPRLSTNTQATLAKAASPVQWNTYLLASPEFNYR